jgi:hypothetical protein
VDEVALIRDTISRYCAVLIAPLSITSRSAGPNFFWTQPKPGVAIAECIRSGGVWEAESNMGLLCLVPTPATADWDASVTVEACYCEYRSQ